METEQAKRDALRVRITLVSMAEVMVVLANRLRSLQTACVNAKTVPRECREELHNISAELHRHGDHLKYVIEKIG